MDEEDENNEASLVLANDDEESEKSSEEESLKDEEDSDSWPSFEDQIDSFHLNKKYDENIQRLDERRYQIMLRLRESIKKAPKPIGERAMNLKSLVDQQLEINDKRLEELIAYGNELVTNVLVATDHREYERRAYETEVQDSIALEVKRENTESNRTFNKIIERFKQMEKANEPMAIWETIQEQKERMGGIEKSKDALIARCQHEIERINQKFELDRTKQAADVATLVERVDKQVELIRDSYKKHIKLLEDIIEEERQVFTSGANEKWQHFFESMNEDFFEKSETMKAHEEFYTFQIKRISIEQEELTKMTRIRLDKECEALELELRKTRDAVLLNSEKLDYNYQVLQKRNEENVIVSNQQKRSVAKLHEQLVELRAKKQTIKEKTEQRIVRMRDQINKLHAVIVDLERKSHKLRMLNKTKFDRIWDINYKELITNINRIYEIDRLLHEQQLAVPWQKPDIDISDIYDQYRNDELFCKSKQRQRKLEDIENIPSQDINTVRNILYQISDRGEFLLEDKLLKILEPYVDSEKNLVRLDNIFVALHVQSLRDIQEMAKLFEPYTYCPNCSVGLTVDKCREAFLNKPHKSNPELGDDHNDFEMDTNNSTEKAKRSCSDHYLVMEPTLVAHAMAKFVGKRDEEAYNPYLATTQGMLNYITITEETIREFWNKFRACMPEEKLRLWRKLEHGLNHYLEVLKLRKQYDEECAFLRKQNQELKHLLQKFNV